MKEKIMNKIIDFLNREETYLQYEETKGLVDALERVFGQHASFKKIVNAK